MKSTHISLLGDSIFDNASYVDAGESVSELLSAKLVNAAVSLLAVDGDVTTDVHAQLALLPKSVTHVFLSCGGNDALSSISVLDRPARSVGGAMHEIRDITEKFRRNYRSLLSAALAKSTNLTVCTIYNHVPGLEGNAKAALSVFNEIILEEAISSGVDVLDLRVVCDDVSDYSTMSPIEPSVNGGRKIVERIVSIVLANPGAPSTNVYS